MKSTIENNNLTIFCEGRIDSVCSKEVGAEFEEILKKNDVVSNGTSIVFDFDNLSYISSAGLREFLIITKKYKNIKIVNASAGVYEIFETTGFSKIFDISKKLREVSVEGCQIVGQGANGVVYRLDRDTIIKVYNNLHQLADIQESLAMAKDLLISGVPVAISYDVVKVGDAYGAVFEMFDMDTLGQFISKNPERLEECAIKTAKMLHELHNTELPEKILPDARLICKKWITDDSFLTEDEKSKLLVISDTVSFRNTFIHGDFHCGNIMIQDGELMLIDIDEAAVGDPVFDFAMMYLTFFVATTILPGDRIAKIMSITVEQIQQFWSVFEKTYYSDVSEEELTGIRERYRLFALIKVLYIFDKDPKFPQELKAYFKSELFKRLP